MRVIGGEVVWSKEKNISIPTEKRGLGMVFQTYAIWPHMNVFDNVAYPLQIRNVPRDAIRQRVAKTLVITSYSIHYTKLYEIHGTLRLINFFKALSRSSEDKL